MGNAASSQQKNHSSASSASASASSSAVICYYELLGIELTATPDEIKKAYRTKALQQHPDKNMHRIQEATEMFSKIQNAYQVLSDPQERAFYDRHRESILRKGKKSRVSESGYTVDDIMNFFDPSVFKGFNDDPKGFYAVYRDLFAFFEDLEAEESDNPSKYDFTSFGSKYTPFEPSLKIFYDKFVHFSSNRTFYEADNYDEQHAENRRHRRAISKENQRLRDAMRREYTDTIRNLALWVRKRDPRWQAYQKERNLQKQSADARRKEEVIRKRAEMAENYVAPDWSVNNFDNAVEDEETFLLQQLERLQFEEFQSQSSRDSESISMKTKNIEKEKENSGDDKDEDFDEFDDFYCVVCKKVFKNHKQWKNHEQSKKHISNMLKAGFKPESEEELYDDETESDDKSEYEFDEKFVEVNSDYDSINNDKDKDNDNENDEDYVNVSDDEITCDENCNEENDLIIIKDLISKNHESEKLEIGQKPPKKKIRNRKIITPVESSKTSTIKSKSNQKTTTAKSNSTTALKCSVCLQSFDSRNKLFKHIEVTGHAVATAASKSKKKK